jgi:hypothetical protein
MLTGALLAGRPPKIVRTDSLEPVQSSHRFAKVRLADMSIPGCHRNICVSTHFLDNLQIAGVHHQPCSKCVSEVMPTEVRYLGLNQSGQPPFASCGPENNLPIDGYP